MSKMTPQQELAIGFAKLELLELEAGMRRLGDCPGLEQVGKMIADHKIEKAGIPVEQGDHSE